MATAPPGWYPDAAPNLLRWWDGTQWTLQTAPAPQTQPSPLQVVADRELERSGRPRPAPESLRACAGGADRFVIVDTETTGVYNSDRILEIALITLSLDGDVLDEFDTLVQPQRDVSATHIHGITAAMVAHAPTFSEIAGDVAVRLDGSCLVAHNLPFDYRMLANEFAHLQSTLTVVSGACTMTATGRSLIDACVEWDVQHLAAHRARSDATATAQLFLHVVDTCKLGAPVAAPVELTRTGRVFRREDSRVVQLPDPPLIVYLASRLAHPGVEVKTLMYLELLGRAVADMRIDAEERHELSRLAHELGLNEARIAQAHRRYLDDLISAAVQDGRVTDDEYETVVRIAAALSIDQKIVETRIHPFRSAESLVTLSPGMRIVFTGDHPDYDRAVFIEAASGLGLHVQPGVTKKIDLVAAADAKSNSGKAGKARSYGIPIIASVDLIGANVGDSVQSHGAGQIGLKVITCSACHATWTVAATSSERSSQVCAECKPR